MQKRKEQLVEPCELLNKKLKEHNTIVMCPYCDQLFDVHVGLIFLEGKQIKPPPRDMHKYFEQVMQPKV